ncbi:MAG: ROK family protein, partial [Candidatus Omnitrophica bacterium]|nr:ROK family protein [Candidatus Omnitrophota bacterium]
MPDKIIGIDIGGTKISMVIAKSDGDILKKEIIPTETTKPPKGMLDRVKKTIRCLMKELDLKEKNIKGIGIGCGGPLDPKSGVLHSAPNLPMWRNVHIKDEILSEFDLPIIMDNDANAAALGEKLFGAGRNVRNLFYYTISTGIGGGLIIDGRIY